MLFHNLPKRAWVRRGRLSLIKQRRSPPQHGPINRKAMPHNPPNITGRKVRITKPNIHNMIHSPLQSHRGPPLIPHNALRRTCRSRSVQNVEWIGAKHFLTLDVLEGEILNAVGEPGGGTGDLVGGTLVD